MSLQTILDAIVDDLTTVNPKMSDAEASLIATRMNLFALTQNLMEMGAAGYSLDNDGLFGLSTGLVESCEWLLAKEMAWSLNRDLENLGDDA